MKKIGSALVGVVAGISLPAFDVGRYENRIHSASRNYEIRLTRSEAVFVRLAERGEGMRKFAAFGALAVALTACGGDPSQVGPMPSNYQESVRKYVRTAFYDPYSMRDVRLSTPQPGHLLFQSGWVVCLEANAKNRMGGYTGLTRTAILINNNAVVTSLPDAPVCNDSRMVYASFSAD